MSGGFPDELGKWLAVAGALASVGVLPKTWQKNLAIAASLLWLYRQW